MRKMYIHYLSGKHCLSRMKFCVEIPNQSPMIHILEIATVVELTPFINQSKESPNTRTNSILRPLLMSSSRN